MSIKDEKSKLHVDESQNEIAITYLFTPDEQQTALHKLAQAAKKYDKNHPSSVQLDAFDVAYMEPHVFKGQLKQVFGMKVTEGEFNALMTLFDAERRGVVVCSEFLLKVSVDSSDSVILLCFVVVLVCVVSKARNRREREGEKRVARERARTASYYD